MSDINALCSCGHEMFMHCFNHGPCTDMVDDAWSPDCKCGNFWPAEPEGGV